MDFVPSGLGSLIATIEVPANETPSFVDLNTLKADCLQYDKKNPNGVLYPVRYRVQAVDNSNSESVLSDFISSIGIRNGTIKYDWDNLSIGEIENANKPEDYYFNNLSVGEISENENVSRNAIHKSIKSIENKLYFYEEKLKLYQKSQELNTLLANIKDEKLKKDIKNIL